MDLGVRNGNKIRILIQERREIMEEIIKRTESQYIIIRGKGGGKEYFDGANIYGRDNAGILKVSKTKW